MIGSRTAPSPTCRPIDASSASRCAALHRSSFASPWPIVELERLLLDSAVIADGVGEPGPLSGFGLSRRAADEAEILTIAVDTAARGKGLASALLGFHLARLTRAGVAQLFLEVDESNTAALALYRRYGFVQVGKRAGYYARPDGTRATALVRKCAL